MVICLEQDASDLYMVQLMPVPPCHLLLHQISEWLNLSGAGLPCCPGKEAVKRVSVCVCSSHLCAVMQLSVKLSAPFAK